MFKDVSQQAAPSMVVISVNDTELSVPAGYTVAAALLANGYRANRTSNVSEEKRGPYCMMGVCFECLVEINGIPNQQGCMTNIEEGMLIRLQDGRDEGQSLTRCKRNDHHES